MMLAAAAALRAHGLADERIKYELFAASPPHARGRVAPEAAAPTLDVCEVTLTMDGATRRFVMPRRGQSLLEAALAHSLDAPYACRAGVCATCRAKVTEGETEMLANHVLEDYEVRRGYVLTCQAHPLSARVAVSYDD